MEEAVEDIIARGVVELRKNAFGDDVDDVKGLAWTQEQAWKVIKMLSQSQDVPYYDMLIGFPFKGDEGALRNMEHAELIAIDTKDGMYVSNEQLRVLIVYEQGGRQQYDLANPYFARYLKGWSTVSDIRLVV